MCKAQAHLPRAEESVHPVHHQAVEAHPVHQVAAVPAVKQAHQVHRVVDHPQAVVLPQVDQVHLLQAPVDLVHQAAVQALVVMK